MRVTGKLNELTKIILKSGDSKDLTLIAPATFTAASATFTLPDVTSDIFVMRDAAQTLTNKTLTSPIISALASLTMPDAGFILTDDVTPSKQLKFQASSVPASSTTTITPPIDDDTGESPATATLVGIATKQTLTNKTITEPLLDRWSTLQNIPSASVDTPAAGKVNTFLDTDGAVKYKDEFGAVFGMPSNTPEASATVTGTVNTIAQSMSGLKTFTVASGAQNFTINTDDASDSQITFNTSTTARASIGWDESASRMQFSTGATLATGAGLAVDAFGTWAPQGSATNPGYSFSGLTNTGLYASASTISVAIDTVQAATISTSGLRVRNGSAGNPSLGFLGDTTAGFYVTGDNNVVRWTGSVAEGGYLHDGGIRTVNGSAAAPAYSFFSSGNSDTGLYGGTGFALLSVDGIGKFGAVAAGLRVYSLGSVGAPALHFNGDNNSGWYWNASGDWRWSSDGTESVRFDGNFVGIGTTTSSSSTLRISTSATGQCNLQMGDTDVDAGGLIYSNSTNNLTLRANATSWMTLYSNGQLELEHAGSAGTPSLYFNDDSNTGFYNDGGSISGTIQWSGNGTAGGYLYSGGIRVPDGSSAAPSYAFLDVDSGFYQSSSGNIRISIFGNSRYRFNNIEFTPTVAGLDLGQPGAGEFWDNVYADDYVNISDGRLKEDIQDTEIGLEFLKLLRPVSYRKLGKTRRHQGFIAQEFKTAMDTAGIPSENYAAYVDSTVGGKTSEDGDLVDVKAIRYIQIIAPLVKAVQELSARLEALENA